MSNTLILIIISVLFAGGNFYYAQTNSGFNGGETYDQQVQVAPVQFETINEYISLLLDPATSTKYYIKYIPDGLVSVYDKEVMLDGVESIATVHAKPGWDKKGVEELQVFYIEIGDAESEEYLPYYYGPFHGKLRKMLNK